METEGKRRDEIASWKIAGCGALTGEVLWAANYPFDVVKSKMQADGFGAEQRYCNMRDVIRQTWRTHGLHGFFSRLGPNTAAGSAGVCRLLRCVCALSRLAV